jgi:hypothetical protein
MTPYRTPYRAHAVPTPYWPGTASVANPANCLYGSLLTPYRTPYPRCTVLTPYYSLPLGGVRRGSTAWRLVSLPSFPALPWTSSRRGSEPGPGEGVTKPGPPYGLPAAGYGRRRAVAVRPRRLFTLGLPAGQAYTTRSKHDSTVGHRSPNTDARQAATAHGVCQRGVKAVRNQARCLMKTHTRHGSRNLQSQAPSRGDD